MDKARTGIFLDTTPSIRSIINSTSEINAVLEDNQFGSDIDIDLIGLGTGIYVNSELLLMDD